MSVKTISRRLALALAFTALLGPSSAATLGQPAGPVILSVKGKIAVTNNGKSADFDIAMLEALPKTSFETSTPWTDADTVFEGVALTDLIAAVGASGGTIVASALNDYSVPIPASDAQAGVMIAYRLNGEYMQVKDKGPLWVIYPFDDRPELKTETKYSRSVWQLTSLDFVD